MKRLAVAALLVLALAGCDDAPASGTVVSKSYTPAHTDWYTQCTPVGKVTVCHPQPIIYDDEWRICIKDAKRTGCKDIGASEYASYQVGDYYPHGGAR